MSVFIREFDWPSAEQLHGDRMTHEFRPKPESDGALWVYVESPETTYSYKAKALLGSK